MFKYEKDVYPLICECAKLLSSRPLFFLLNSYTAGFAPQVAANMLKCALSRGRNGSAKHRPFHGPRSGASLWRHRPVDAMKPHILYEDNHLLVVVKPFNIPVQADISGDMDLLTFYKQYLKQTYHKPGDAYLGLVHRLDRPTGGVMVFAKTSKSGRALVASNAAKPDAKRRIFTL